jgi:hypothetical protein
MIADHNLVKKSFGPMIAGHDLVRAIMDAEVSTHIFLTMIIEEYVCFMSCEPFFFLQLFLCGTFFLSSGMDRYSFMSAHSCVFQ